MEPVDHGPAARRAAIVGLARALGATVLVVAAYFVLPLDWIADVPVLITAPVAVVGFAALLTAQVGSIMRSNVPAIRAVEALGTSLPLFLVAFAGAYYAMGVADPTWFSESMSKLDALYFTVTVFATVGFGDITATAAPSRAVVTLQMALGLVVLGLGVRLILGAVQEARKRQAGPTGGGAG